MFGLILFIVFSIFAFVCISREKYLHEHDLSSDGGWGFLGSVFVAFTVFFIVATPIKTMCGYANQISDIETYRMSAQQEKIYQVKAENLTNEFSHYLEEVYPNFEKDVFTRISPKDVDIYLVKYPELKSSETIKMLVNQIRDLQDSVYKQQLLRAELLRNMRYRKKNPWNIGVFIPNIPKDISEKR